MPGLELVWCSRQERVWLHAIHQFVQNKPYSYTYDNTNAINNTGYFQIWLVISQITFGCAEESITDLQPILKGTLSISSIFKMWRHKMGVLIITYHVQSDWGAAFHVSGTYTCSMQPDLLSLYGSDARD